ncbi:hypothetical protein [Natronobacterium lacisalsi]|nr:hypothetical protein [Halobiforma lacisalsi]
MDAGQRRQWGLLVGCLLVTGIVYLGLIPRLVLEGDGSRAVRYVGLGWVPYTCLFYVVGRLFSTPETLPNMRAADAGLGLFLVALLLSLGLDAWGFTPEAVPAAHALQAVAVFVGLALFGWGLGRRSKAIATKTDADTERRSSE